MSHVANCTDCLKLTRALHISIKLMQPSLRYKKELINIRD